MRHRGDSTHALIFATRRTSPERCSEHEVAVHREKQVTPTRAALLTHERQCAGRSFACALRASERVRDDRGALDTLTPVGRAARP
jgi:hypothetical protein